MDYNSLQYRISTVPGNLYYLVSGTNNIVIFVSTSMKLINFLSRGLLDCKIKSFKTAILNNYVLNSFAKLETVEFDKFITNDENTLFAVRRNAQLNLDEIVQFIQPDGEGQIDDVTLDRICELRRLARIRATYISQIENEIQTSLARSAQSDLCSDYALQYAIDNSDPDSNQYSDEIIEYAALSNLDPNFVHNEIKLKLESKRLTEIRALALFEKYLILINQSDTYEKAQAVYMDLFVNLYHKAAI